LDLRGLLLREKNGIGEGKEKGRDSGWEEESGGEEEGNGGEERIGDEKEGRFASS